MLVVLALALAASTGSEARCTTVFDAVDAALGRSPSIVRAQAEKGVAEARLVAAKSEGLPRIDLFAQTGIGENLPLDQVRDDQVGVSANWELFTFGQRAAANEAARQDLRAAAEGTLDAMTRMAERTMLLALELDRTERIVDLASTQVEGYARDAETAERRLSRGLITLSDARQIEARYEAALARQEEAAIARDVAAAELSVLTGFPVSCIKDQSTDLLSTWLAERMASMSPDAALGEATDFAAHIRRAEAELDAARARLTEANRAGLPSLSVNAFVLGEYDDSSLPVDDRWSRDDRVGFSVRQELYASGALKAQRAERRSQLRGAEATLEGELQELEIDVRRAALSAVRRNAIFKRRSAAEKAARERFEATQYEVERGTKTITDFVLANEDYYTASIDAVTARFERDQERLRLARLTGAIVDLSVVATEIE